MLSHQKQTGMTAHYVNSNARLMHLHETMLGDTRLFHWVMMYKPFLQGKPVPKLPRSFRASKGLDDGGTPWERFARPLPGRA